MNRLIAGMSLACLATIAAAAASARDEWVFDQNKGKMYAVYARELRNHPDLKGRVVLELKISTNGRVTACRVVSTDAATGGLGDKLCERTREFQFEPRPAATTFTKSLEFFPAS